MLEVAAFVIFVFNLLSTWRFSVVLLGAAAVFLACFSALAPGVPRLVGFAACLFVGISVGFFWQRHHERKLKGRLPR